MHLVGDLIYSTALPLLWHWFDIRARQTTADLLYPFNVIWRILLNYSETTLAIVIEIWSENICIFHLLFEQNKIKEKSGKFPFGKKKKVLNFLFCVSFRNESIVIILWWLMKIYYILYQNKNKEAKATEEERVPLKVSTPEEDVNQTPNNHVSKVYT